MITNMIFEIFAIYVICENILIDIVSEGREVLKALSENFDNCSSVSLKKHIAFICMLTYGVDPIEELTKIVKFLDRSVTKISDSTTLEYIELRNNKYTNSSSNQSLNPDNEKKIKWSIEKENQPSCILLGKIVGNGYLKPTLDNYLLNKFKFGHSESNELSNLIHLSLSWDPVDRPSTLEFLHLNLFNRFKLVPDSFDLVKNESKCLSHRDMVISKNDPFDILTIHFHSLKNYNLCGQAFDDNKHIFEKIYSSDFVSKRFIKKQILEGIDNMTISSYNSYVLSHDLLYNRLENIFCLNSVTKDYVLSKKILETGKEFMSKYISDNSKSNNVTFNYDFGIGWKKIVLPVIMKSYFEMSIISPMMGSHVPRLCPKQQQMLVKNIIFPGFLSIYDKKSMINPIKCSFDSFIIIPQVELRDGTQTNEIGYFTRFEPSSENEESDTEIQKMVKTNTDAVNRFLRIITSQINQNTDTPIVDKIRQNFSFLFIVDENLLQQLCT